MRNKEECISKYASTLYSYIYLAIEFFVSSNHFVAFIQKY